MSDNPYKSPETNESRLRDSSTIGRRPVAISGVCIVFGSVMGPSLFLLPTIASRRAESYGTWFAVLYVVSFAAAVASIVGYWRMKRWGVYLYTAAFVVGTGVGLAMGVPFTVVGVVVPLAFIGLGFGYIGQMQ